MTRSAPTRSIRGADLRVHRHPGRLEVDVRVALGDVDRTVDVDDVPMPHVAEHEPQLGELDRQLLDAPGQGEDRMPAVDQHGHPALDQQRGERMDARVVGVIAVEQRVQLHPEELRVLEELGRLLRVAGLARVRPVQRPRVRHPLDDPAGERVVRVKDDPGLVVELLEQARPGRPRRARRRRAGTRRRACAGRRSPRADRLAWVPGLQPPCRSPRADVRLIANC